MPLIPALGKQRQADLCEVEASLVYIASYRSPRATEKPCLNEPSLKKKKKSWSQKKVTQQFIAVKHRQHSVMPHACNPSLQEAEAGASDAATLKPDWFVSSKSAWDNTVRPDF